MKCIICFLLMWSFTAFSCQGNKNKGNLAHLSDSVYLQANPVADLFGNYDLYDRMNHYRVPGLSITVVRDGKIVWAEGYGKADVPNNRKVDSNTLFQAASISKPIAALGILKLAESNLVDLDEDVNKYLKSYQIPENKFTREKKVTLRGILTHTAGLNVEGFGGYSAHQQLPSTNGVINGEGNTEKVIVEAVPGSRWNYSGGGYTIMQKVIEDVTDQAFEEFMKDEVLLPLGMTNSTFEQPLSLENHPNVSSAFDSDGSLIEGNWHLYPEKAAAGLWTTPSDLAKYCIGIQQIFSGQTTDGILKKATVEAMFNNFHSLEHFNPSANIPSDYKRYWGLGPEMVVNGKIIRFQHAGFNEGFKANLTAFANEGKAIIIMANADNGFDLIMEVEKVISDYYYLGIWK